MPATVLVVGYDKENTANLVDHLKKDYGVICVHSGRQAILEARSRHLDAMVVDATSSRLNHRTVCHKLRVATSAPIILITTPSGKVDGSISPAHVIHTPVTAKRLQSRVKSAIDARPPRMMSVGSISLDLEKRRVSRGSKSFRVTPKETRLLRLLMARPGQTVSRKTIMHEIWETDYLGDTRTLDVHIRWVREKVEDNPDKPQRLITIKGQGYRFME